MNLHEKIKSFRGLKCNWDGFGASAPTDDDLDFAEAFAKTLVGIPGILQPVFGVDSDGLPVFTTIIDNIYIKISIESPGHMSLYSIINEIEYVLNEVKVSHSDLPIFLSQAYGPVFELNKVSDEGAVS